MPSIEEQLILLIQQQQAQQDRLSTAPDALLPASRDTRDVWTGQQYSQQSSLDYLQLPLHQQSDGLRRSDGLLQQPSREHLQPPSHLQSDRARLPDGLLQLQLQRQLQNLSQQQALENLQYQQQGQSDRAMLPGGLLDAQQQSQAFAALTGQQTHQQLTMEQLQYFHQLQQNEKGVPASSDFGRCSPFPFAENASMPQDPPSQQLPSELYRT
jgi:hypothetical protein